MYRGGLQGPPRSVRLDRKNIILRDPPVAVGAHVKVNKFELRSVGGRLLSSPKLFRDSDHRCLSIWEFGIKCQDFATERAKWVRERAVG